MTSGYTPDVIQHVCGVFAHKGGLRLESSPVALRGGSSLSIVQEGTPR